MMKQDYFNLLLHDVWIYPDRITVKVALDNGDIIGFNATDYYRNHQDREINNQNYF